MNRKQISKKTRFEIFKRDGFECQYCGAHPPSVVLQVDHIIPVAEGGENEMDNLITSCQPCNIGKGARSLKSIPQSLKDKAEDIEERESQILGYQKIIQAKEERLENQAWEVLSLIVSEKSGELSVRKDWFRSTKKFIDRLGFNVVYESMEIASSRYPYSKTRAFPYFCGVCWNKIRELENGQN